MSELLLVVTKQMDSRKCHLELEHLRGHLRATTVIVLISLKVEL